MAHGVNDVISEESSVKMVTAKQQNHHSQQNVNVRKTVGVIGSRRIFAPAFKLKVLDSYRNDIDCRGNQRATARKYGIHRRQIQKWLQCEDNLRSSCSEIVPGTSAIVNSKRILKSEDSTGHGVSPASPALNLSLARLHGDELPVQQGPPPSHPPSLNSPSAPEFPFHTIIPLRVTPVSYNDYPNQDQHLAPEHHLQDVHKYVGDLVDPELKYYVSNPENLEFNSSARTTTSTAAASAGFGNRSEVKLYQPLTPYHSPQDHRYDINDANTSNDHHLHNSQHRLHQNYQDVDLPEDARITRAVVLHEPAEIKTERASPDSAATSGLYEMLGSPSASLVSFSSPHETTITTTNSPTTHCELTQQSIPPVLMYIRQHSQPDSEKPRCHGEETRETKIEGKLELKNEENEKKKEVEVRHEEAVMREVELDGEGREGVSCTDYQRPPAGCSSSLTNTGTISPERVEPYSVPSSPQGPGSSGRSSSSCSDSETDVMDYASSYQTISGDLTRRRSFSLRFKLDVLDAFHRDVFVAGNQRATARKFGINRRQVQKWLGQETELRGEITLRGGNSRQRLGSNPESASGELPVDLRVTGIGSNPVETHFEHYSPTLYCCEAAVSPTSQSYCQQPRFAESPDASYKTCNFSCCTENPFIMSPSCYEETRRPCYNEPQGNLYCYSAKEPMSTLTVNQELTSSELKRSACSLSCCHQTTPPSKRLCFESSKGSCASLCQEQPPQESPLCLVKPKTMCQAQTQIEPVTSTVLTPAAPVISCTPSSKKDAILFKPYLDNPISKSTDESGDHVLSTLNSNNNNCQGICNLNEGRGHDYALELSLRVPVSWRTQQSSYCDFSQIKSAFVRYPASPHYT